MAVLDAAAGAAASSTRRAASRLADLQQAVRDARAVASGQRSVPVVPSRSPMPQAARVGIGNSTSAALGDDIPRPRPTADTTPAPMLAGMTLSTPGGAAPDPTALRALIERAATNPDSLSMLDALELVRAGADPDMLFADPMSLERAAEVLQRAEAEGSLDFLTPNEIAALQRTPANGPAVDPVAAVVPDEIAPVVGDPLEGGLTDTTAAGPDSLASSDMELSPVRLTQPSGTVTLKPEKLTNLAQRIWQATVPTAGEPLSTQTLNKLQRDIANLSPESRQALLEHPDLAAGISSARTPEAREAAIAGATKRLQDLAELASISTTDRGAAQIVNAANARTAGEAASGDGPRPVMPQGSRSLDVAVQDVPANELPTMYDEARAAAREAAERTGVRQPNTEFPLEERLAAAGVDNARKLPLYLKGREGRSQSLESRSVADRGLESRDIRTLKPLVDAHERLRAATTAEEIAAAQLDIANAEADLNRKYSTRRHKVPGYTYINNKGQRVRVPDEYHTGRPAMPDSKLNRGGQQDTFNEVVVGMVGSRPRVGTGPARSSADLSPAERAAQQADISGVYGDDAAPLLPSDPLLDAALSDEGGRRGRLGGGQRQSRRQGSVQAMFGGSNPFALRTTTGDPLFTSAGEVAAYILRKQDLDPAGGAWNAQALESVARSVSRDFLDGADNIDEASDAARIAAGYMDRPPASSDPSPTPTPAGDIREGTSLDVDALPALPGRQNAIDLPEPVQKSRNFSSAAPAQDDGPDIASFPTRGMRDAAIPDDDAGISANLASSDIEIPDIPNSKPVGTGGSTKPVSGGRRRTRKEVDDEIAQVEQDARDEWRDSGLDSREIEVEVRKKVNARRKELEDEVLPMTGESSTPVGDASAEKPSARKNNKKNKPEQAADATGTSASDEGAAAAKNAEEAKKAEADATKPADADPSKPKDADGGKTGGDGGKKADEKQPGFLRRMLGPAGLITAAGGGIVLLARGRGGSASGGAVDIPLPIGGGGGGAGGDGGYLPVPPGGSGSGMANGISEEEAAIQRALDRIRGTRPSGQRRATQTLMNY